MARSQSPDTAVINELMRCYFYPDAVITTSTNGPSEGFSAQISTEETPSGASVSTAFIEITSQPCKELRFRYVREDSRAVIHGRESGFVKAKIRNYSGPYSVRASLVTDEVIRRPHPHKLKGSNCNDGVWEKSCNDYLNEEPEFELCDVGLVGMKINADGEEVRRSLEERMARGIDPFNSGDFTGHNLKPFIHQVRICFEATILLDGQFVTLPAVVSDPIRNTRHRGCDGSQIEPIRPSCLSICRIVPSVISTTCATEIAIFTDRLGEGTFWVCFQYGGNSTNVQVKPGDIHNHCVVTVLAPHLPRIHNQPAVAHVRLCRDEGNSTPTYSNAVELRYTVQLPPSSSGASHPLRSSVVTR